MFRALLILVVAAAIPRVAAAHPAPFSFLDLIIRADGVDGILVLHVVDIAHDLGVEPAERVMEPDVIAQQRERIDEVRLVAARYLEQAERDAPAVGLELGIEEQVLGPREARGEPREIGGGRDELHSKRSTTRSASAVGPCSARGRPILIDYLIVSMGYAGRSPRGLRFLRSRD